jgi:hypothetical protein
MPAFSITPGEKRTVPEQVREARALWTEKRNIDWNRRPREPERISMKRFLTVLIAAAFFLTLFAPAGCGGDKAKAQEYMRNGDDIINGLSIRYGGIEQQTNMLLDEYNKGATMDAAGVKAKIDEINGTMNDAEGDAMQAGADYSSIKQLQGVQDYAMYAEYRLEMLRKLSEMKGLLGAMLAEIEKSNASGQAPDMARLQELSNEVENRGAEMSALDRQATDYKSEKNL